MKAHSRNSSLSFVMVVGVAACTPAAPAPAVTPMPVEGASASPLESTSTAASNSAEAGTSPPPSKQGPAGAMCGGIAGFGCATGLYCDFTVEAHCGAADQSGVCKPIPEMCTEQYQPVCGCDDKTYANTCFAARGGISIALMGECAAAQPSPTQPSLQAGELCGTRGVSGTCADGLYCKFKSACGATDSGGSCVGRPSACTKIYKPVCGCDGNTYPSDCVAASQGVDVASAGACP